MKKLLFIALIVSSIFIACEEQERDTYLLKGTIEGLPNAKLNLEFLTFNGNTKIDTATTDASGKFSFEGKVEEPGYYRIMSGQKFWLLFLDNEKVTFKANANDPKLQEVSIEGYERGQKFQEAIEFVANQQSKVEEISNRFQQMQSSGASQEQLMQVQMEFQGLDQEIKKNLRAYIDEVEDPLISLYLLSSFNLQDDSERDFVKSKMQAITAAAPNSVYVKEYTDKIVQMENAIAEQKATEAASQRVDIGVQAPEIIQKNPNGKDLKLSDLQGQVVLVDFWASWCKPCRIENPNLVKAYNKYKNQGFTIFSVSLDKDRNAWLQAIEQDNLTWEYHTSDLKFWQNAAAQLYGVNSIPAAFLIDREGKIVGKNLRGDALEAKIKEVI